MTDQDKLAGLRKIHEISGMDGTWNYNDYTQGIYNGLEMALAIIEDREPVFKQSPDVWLEDMPSERPQTTILTQE